MRTSPPSINVRAQRLGSLALRAPPLNHPQFVIRQHIRHQHPRRGPDIALQVKDPPSRDHVELQATACRPVSCACRERAEAPA